MEIPNLFVLKNSNRPDRESKLLEIRNDPYSDPSEDFYSYGFDYFDNSKVSSGYRSYKYDGSLKKPINSIINDFNLNNSHKIADYGCAKGYLLYEFMLKGFDVIGFDKSAYAIKNAHSSVKDSIILCENLNVISKYDFSFLICRNVLPHLKKDDIMNLIELAIKHTFIRPYFVVHTYNSNEYRKDYELWDRTHLTIMNADEWRSFLKPFQNKILFSLDCLF